MWDYGGLCIGLLAIEQQIIEMWDYGGLCTGVLAVEVWGGGQIIDVLCGIMGVSIG